MYAPMLFTIVTLFLSITTVHARKVTNPARVPQKAVLLSKVASLTLRANKLTSSRRVKAIPQLDCVGPEHVCALYKVDVMRCKNEGADYDAENIQWSCKASLPEEFKLGSTDVVCEGYESGDDPYILKGSCGVEYRLLLTEKGMRRYGIDQRHNTEGSWQGASTRKPSKFGSVLFGIVFVAVLFIIVRAIVRQARNAPQRRGPGHGPRGGGNDDDPPPPYDYPPSYPRSPPHKQNQRASSSSTGTGSSSSSSQARNQQGSAWRPGFWTGAATGAAAGYAANRMANRSQTQDTRRPTVEVPAARNPLTGLGSLPSPSSERHESTGFGGTRRR